MAAHARAHAYHDGDADTVGRIVREMRVARDQLKHEVAADQTGNGADNEDAHLDESGVRGRGEPI